MDRHHLVSDLIDVTVQAHGAELCSIAHANYGEMLWQAGPIWPQHAPNLFPIVGQLAGNRLRYDGAQYELNRHGFARNRDFTWIEHSAKACRLELRDDVQTRAAFPFAFRFEIGYALANDLLDVTFRIENPGSRTLPASVGAHPAFRWPLADGIPKQAHTLEFSDAEPAPIRRLLDGLLKVERFPTPIDGHILQLSDDLFTSDAIVMDRVASRWVRYSAPGSPAIVVTWEHFRELGLWSKPTADFVCIEPWFGYASPVDFDGEFSEKPGLLLIPPGEAETLALSIRIAEPRDSRPASP